MGGRPERIGYDKPFFYIFIKKIMYGVLLTQPHTHGEST